MLAVFKYKKTITLSIISFYLLINSYILHANEPTKEPPTISISLADTVAQKEKTLLQKQITSSVSKEKEKEIEDEKPGFLARYLPFLSTQKEDNPLGSTEVNSPNSDHASLSSYKQKYSRKKPIFKNDYDDHFRKYSKHYFGIGADWTWFKAQAIVESELRPNAKSKSGAMGLMQIMPKTYHEIKRSNPHFGDAYNPYYSIAAGIYYNRKIYESWHEIDDPDERRKYMFASYNAGLGSIQRIHKRVGNVNSFKMLIPLLHTEPKNYVIKIEREHKLINQ